MARTIGVFEGPNSLQEVFGRNVPNRKSYKSCEALLRALAAGEIDGAVLPQAMIPSGMVATKMARGFVYIKLSLPSDEVRRRRARARITARHAQRAAGDTSMRCASFAP